MNRTETIRIDYIGPSTNAIYAGIHWRRRKAHADEAHLLTKIAVKGVKNFTTAVSLEFQPMVRGRTYDCDNYGFTNKLICDGLVHAGILPDDTNEWVKRIIINAPIKIKKPEESHMIVTIREA